MNSSSEALRRELGEVFTPPSVAASICKRLSNLNLLEGAKILEPSVGDGAFVSALNAGTTKPAHITAVDLNANSLAAIFESEGDIPLTKIADDSCGFTKFNPYASLTLFDIAWASNVFIATHLNGDKLKVDIDMNNQHYLNVDISNDNILLKTNITSQYGRISSEYCPVSNGIVKKWIFGDNKPANPLITECSFVPDVLIIHRTKLKELVTKYEKLNIDFVFEILSKYPQLNILVTTGSGTTHGIKGNYKILPFTTLFSLILGNRVKKLHLTKLIMQLNKNKI